MKKTPYFNLNQDFNVLSKHFVSGAPSTSGEALHYAPTFTIYLIHPTFQWSKGSKILITDTTYQKIEFNLEVTKNNGNFIINSINLKEKVQKTSFNLSQTPWFKNWVYALKKKKKVKKNGRVFFQVRFSFCKSCIFYYKSFLLELFLFHFLESKGALCLYLNVLKCLLMTSFFSFTSDIFFLIANPEINMTKHSFPVSSHTKAVWAMHSFCCLYYPVKNRENLAVPQVLKNKVKRKLSYH